MACRSVVPSQQSFGCCPVLYPEVVLPSRPQVYPHGPMPANVVDSQICFVPVLWVVWSRTQPCTQCPVPNLLPVQGWVAAPQNPLTSVKSGDVGRMPWCCRPEVLPQCCQNAVSPTMVGLRFFGSCCQRSGAGLAQLLSAGLLQMFMVVFENKTRFIKQLGLRERMFFGSASGAGILQSPGQCLQCCLTWLP